MALETPEGKTTQRDGRLLRINIVVICLLASERPRGFVSALYCLIVRFGKVLHDLAHCLSLLTPLTYLIARYVTNDRKLVIIFWTQLADSHFCALQQTISPTWNVLPMNVKKENAYIWLKSQLHCYLLYIIWFYKVFLIPLSTLYIFH